MVKINFKDMIILIFFCIAIIFSAVVIGYVISAAIVYLKEGVFIFNWKEVVLNAIKKGCIGGGILGVGIWIKGKVREWQAQKK